MDYENSVDSRNKKLFYEFLLTLWSLRIIKNLFNYITIKNNSKYLEYFKRIVLIMI